MKIGVSTTITDYSIDVAVLASRAEELGFDSLWLGEHPIIPITATSRYPGSADGTLPEAANRMADPFMALARASAITKTIKLGTGVCLIPERNLLKSKVIVPPDCLNPKILPAATLRTAISSRGEAYRSVPDCRLAPPVV
jgi:hypothetical protein